MFGPNRRLLFIVSLLLAIAAPFCAVPSGVAVKAAAPDGKSPKVEFSEEGKLKQPVGFRKWVYIGTPLTPNDLNNGEAAFPEFHSVYMDPDSFAVYEQTGIYPDGTVLVKELIAVGDREASSGKGYFMGDFTGLEVSIKDKQRFADEPGNWAYFSFGHKYPLKTEVAKNLTASCNKCHQDNANEFVFDKYYPVLRAATPKTK